MSTKKCSIIINGWYNYVTIVYIIGINYEYPIILFAKLKQVFL